MGGECITQKEGGKGHRGGLVVSTPTPSSTAAARKGGGVGAPPPSTPTTPTEAKLTRVGEFRVMAPLPVLRSMPPVEARAAIVP